ncbi:MAG: hypothetical protein Q9227_005990 [Pyrenula ochraceoflavens]
MSVAPIITFKAGTCDLEPGTNKVKANPTRGYVYLYSSEDELIHFCWRPRSAQLDQAELDLVMVPADATFTPFTEGPQNGRIYVLKFSSSSQRHLFWLQSKAQDPNGSAKFWSPRDKKLGDIVNNLLQGQEVDVQAEIANATGSGGDDGDPDEPMEDVEGADHDHEHHRGGSGGAGPDATGGDIREEGQGAREGGADGGRAAVTSEDPSAIVQNFLRSMGGSQPSAGAQGRVFTTLTDLLTPASTLPTIEKADESIVDRYLDFIPPSLLVLAQQTSDASSVPTNPESISAAKQALSLDQKKDILRKVLRSPQFSQSLSNLTIALRDGGLPSISEALQIPVQNGGYMRRGGVPLGGGEAVEAFLEGVKKQVEEEDKGTGSGGQMDVDQQ